MDNEKRFSESVNEIVRKRRLVLAAASIVAGWVYAYYKSKGPLSEMAERVFFYGPSVVQGSLEAFVTKEYLGNMIASFSSDTKKYYAAAGGFIVGAALAGGANATGYIIFNIADAINKYFNGYP